MLSIQNSQNKIYSQHKIKNSPSFKGKFVKTSVTEASKPITRKISKATLIVGTALGVITNYLLAKFNQIDNSNKYCPSESEYLTKFMDDMANRPFEEFSDSDIEIFEQCNKRFKDLNEY